MSGSPEAYFYIVRQPASLDSITRQLYGNTDSASARDFLRINSIAASRGGHLIPGQPLYVPEPVCYDPAMEENIIAVVGRINDIVKHQMMATEARLLAEQTALVDNAAKHSDLIKSVANVSNSTAGALVSVTNMQTRVIGDKLKHLEQLYKRSYRANGGFNTQFYIQRRRIYESLDTAVGRLSRTIALGSPLDQRARQTLKINSKSQILHWKRNGTGDGLRDFETHFDRMGRISRYLRHGGYLVIGIDGVLTHDTISKACEVGDDRHCHKAMMVEGGGFAGRTAGGVVGGFIGYATCNAVFGIPSVGTSLLWCGLVAGAVGGVVGGAGGGWAGKSIGQRLFENTYPTY